MYNVYIVDITEYLPAYTIVKLLFIPCITTIATNQSINHAFLS